MPLHTEKKIELIDKYKVHATDTGSRMNAYEFSTGS